ncbi:hypothetical protein TVAG_053290 [Trichomonas vaginalis G3]|uniref:Uncharacterized protein n=1 Tax=Trichomonas vaginalis (strain ATCC PRA-98 / G3) TaxID=412133 RepID=A2EMT2_TRIV3|nr:regulation of choline O-acetyltransferase protein [Trichomonas vaginalis G3]EAY06005.1 hypothetical protein TVAG_053290 [Trichomonas vaginalis G3]KAI5512794.1 regulation of choline O-acetyltransferase protein [Trichomonas vaginalis G3]|eukprot:XP_001318228.1 hypothetical protein [Trichomonas vaginalis G3]
MYKKYCQGKQYYNINNEPTIAIDEKMDFQKYVAPQEICSDGMAAIPGSQKCLKYKYIGDDQIEFSDENDNKLICSKTTSTEQDFVIGSTAVNCPPFERFKRSIALDSSHFLNDPFGDEPTKYSEWDKDYVSRDPIKLSPWDPSKFINPVPGGDTEGGNTQNQTDPDHGNEKPDTKPEESKETKTEENSETKTEETTKKEETTEDEQQAERMKKLKIGLGAGIPIFIVVCCLCVLAFFLIKKHVGYQKQVADTEPGDNDADL